MEGVDSSNNNNENDISIPSIFNVIYDQIQKLQILLERSNSYIDANTTSSLAHFDASSGAGRRRLPSHVSYNLRKMMRNIQVSMQDLVSACTTGHGVQTEFGRLDTGGGHVNGSNASKGTPRPVQSQSGVKPQEQKIYHQKHNDKRPQSHSELTFSYWDVAQAVQVLSDQLLWLITIQDVHDDSTMAELLLSMIPTATDLILRVLPLLVKDDDHVARPEHLLINVGYLQTILDRAMAFLQPETDANVNEFLCYLDLLTEGIGPAERLFQILPQPSVQCVYMLQITLPEGLASLQHQLQQTSVENSFDTSAETVEAIVWSKMRMFIDIILKFLVLVLEDSEHGPKKEGSSFWLWILQQLELMVLDENTLTYTDQDARNLVGNLQSYFAHLLEYAVLRLEVYNEVGDCHANQNERDILLHVELAANAIRFQQKFFVQTNQDFSLLRSLWRSLTTFTITCKDSPALDTQSKLFTIDHMWRLTQHVVGTRAGDDDGKPFVCQVDFSTDATLLAASVLCLIEYADTHWSVPANRQWVHRLLEYERGFFGKKLPSNSIRRILQAAMLSVLFLPSSLSTLPEAGGNNTSISTSTSTSSTATTTWTRQDHMRSLIELSIAGNENGYPEKDVWDVFVESQVAEYLASMSNQNCRPPPAF